MEKMRGTGFAGSSPPFLGRERAAIDVHDVGPERRSPRASANAFAPSSDISLFITMSARD